MLPSRLEDLFSMTLLLGELGEHLRKKSASVEQVLRIVYQPQAGAYTRPLLSST